MEFSTIPTFSNFVKNKFLSEPFSLCALNPILLAQCSQFFCDMKLFTYYWASPLPYFHFFLSRFFLTLAFGSLPVAICCVWTLRLKFSRALKRLILGKLSNFTCKFYECCSFFEVVLLTLFQKMRTSTKLLNVGDSLILNRTMVHSFPSKMLELHFLLKKIVNSASAWNHGTWKVKWSVCVSARARACVCN